MGSAALRPSVSVGRLLRQRRKERRLTLREVSDRMAERGERIPTSTLARIEQGKLDPGVRRLHLLLGFYSVSPQVVADLVELERLAVDIPLEQDLDELHELGLELWRKGDIPQGLAYLLAVRAHVPRDEATARLRQRACLSFATAARNLGKLQLARYIVDDLLCDPPDPSLMAQILVLASSVWRGLGSTEAALAFARQAAEHLDSSDRAGSARILEQQARVYLDAGRIDDADEALQQALKHYRAIKDRPGEIRALILRVRILEQRGDLTEASRCARDTIRRAEKHEQASPAAEARILLGRLHVGAQQPDQAVELLRKALSEAVLLEDRPAQFYAHYHLWKAHVAQGDQERARFELQAATHFVGFIDDVSPEADDIRGRVSP